MEDPLGIQDPDSRESNQSDDSSPARSGGAEGETAGLGDLRERLIRRLRHMIASGRATERGLARATGMSQPHLHNALKGKRQMSVEFADLLLHSLGLSVRDLLDESWQNEAEREFAAAAEEQKRIREQTCRALPQHLLNGFTICKMIYDSRDRAVDFITLEVNPAFEQITGLRDVVGKRATDVIPGIFRTMPEFFEIQGRVALTGAPETFEVDFRHINRWLSVSVYSTEKKHFVAVFADITDWKRLQVKLGPQADSGL